MLFVPCLSIKGPDMVAGFLKRRRDRDRETRVVQSLVGADDMFGSWARSIPRGQESCLYAVRPSCRIARFGSFNSLQRICLDAPLPWYSGTLPGGLVLFGDRTSPKATREFYIPGHN